MSNDKKPALQNIPLRTEMGKAMRKVFVPEEGRLFAETDYASIEMRILEQMKNEEKSHG